MPVALTPIEREERARRLCSLVEGGVPVGREDAVWLARELVVALLKVRVLRDKVPVGKQKAVAVEVEAGLVAMGLL